MTDIRWKQRFDNFQRALQHLTAAIQLMQQRPLSRLEEQGLIQGFEFTHELAWNVLKDYLEMEGIQGLVGSRSTTREAFKRGLVGDGEAWMDMIEYGLSPRTVGLLRQILADFPEVEQAKLREHIDRVGVVFYQRQGGADPCSP